MADPDGRPSLPQPCRQESGVRWPRYPRRARDSLCPIHYHPRSGEKSEATRRRGRAAKRARTRRGKGRRPRSAAEPPPQQAARQGAGTARNDRAAGPRANPQPPRIKHRIGGAPAPDGGRGGRSRRRRRGGRGRAAAPRERRTPPTRPKQRPRAQPRRRAKRAPPTARRAAASDRSRAERNT